MHRSTFVNIISEVTNGTIRTKFALGTPNFNQIYHRALYCVLSAFDGKFYRNGLPMTVIEPYPTASDMKKFFMNEGLVSAVEISEAPARSFVNRPWARLREEFPDHNTQRNNFVNGLILFKNHDFEIQDGFAVTGEVIRIMEEKFNELSLRYRLSTRTLETKPVASHEGILDVSEVLLSKMDKETIYFMNISERMFR